MFLPSVPSGFLQTLHRLQSWEALVWGIVFLPWPSSLLQLQDQLRFGITLIKKEQASNSTPGLSLTQGQQAAVGLQHHVPVELPLTVIQVLPLIPGEVHRHILK